jgi:hypothetical protein
VTYADPERRAALIDGLRALATYLESNPGVPVSSHVDVYAFPPDDDCAAMRAEIDLIAARLRARAYETPGGHYDATRSFGPVQYTAAAICNHHQHGTRGDAR